MSESRNHVGKAYALTVFSPILNGREDAVRAAIEGLPRGTAGPFSRFEQVHFARLHILDKLVDQGPGHDEPPLKSAYLIFSVTLDAPLDPFLDGICQRMPEEADSWWSHCVGYPGTADRAAFKRYIRHNQIATNMFAAAYPDATVAEVRESVALRERVLDFAIAAQGIGAAELQERFNQTFADIS